MGSLPERQEFFRSVAKPQDRFQDRASALLMTDDVEAFVRKRPKPFTVHAIRRSTSERQLSLKPAIRLLIFRPQALAAIPLD